MTVEQIVVNYLNEVGLAARGSARGNVPGTDQRHSVIYASPVDIDEAYQVGWKAAQIAAGQGSGYMATLLREPGTSIRSAMTKFRWSWWRTQSALSRNRGSRIANRCHR